MAPSSPLSATVLLPRWTTSTYKTPEATPSHIRYLPGEVLDRICAKIAFDAPTLASLCRASKQRNGIASPFLARFFVKVEAHWPVKLPGEKLSDTGTPVSWDAYHGRVIILKDTLLRLDTDVNHEVAVSSG